MRIIFAFRHIFLYLASKLKVALLRRIFWPFIQFPIHRLFEFLLRRHRKIGDQTRPRPELNINDKTGDDQEKDQQAPMPSLQNDQKRDHKAEK